MVITRLSNDEFDWASGAGGADAVRRIAALATDADGTEALNEAALLTLANRGLATGVLFTASVDGSVEGFAFVQGPPGEPAEVDLVVAPAARGRGLGRGLADAVLGVVDGPLTAWSHGNHPAAAALASRVGLRAVRELWVMRRPAREPVPAWTSPQGYFVRPFEPGPDDEGFLAVNRAAFDFHPEQGSLDQRGLDERKALPWFDPAGFLVGVDDSGVIKGFHWTKVHPASEGEPVRGEVYVIGVDPSAQGTGLGKALLAAGLEHLHGVGVAEVVLYVEADNRAAVRLYEEYGFGHADSDTHVMYAR